MRLLVLTSQCWDPRLCRQVRAKLLRELPEGALVIDYTAALGERGGGGVGEPRRFALVQQVQAPVSWDRGHTFWVWRTEKESGVRVGGIGPV